MNNIIHVLLFINNKTRWDKATWSYQAKGRERRKGERVTLLLEWVKKILFIYNE